MKAISFIITNFNTKKYTEWCYNAIRKNIGYFHEIVMLDDGSTDKFTQLKLDKLSIPNTTVIRHAYDY